jgi:small subunit ribosomal protein S16
VLEELGHYDPMVPDTDARVVMKLERVDYWLGVGAQPSDKAGVLIKKYGSNGTHRTQQAAALEKLDLKRRPAARSVSPTAAPAPVAAAAPGAAPADDSPAAE